MLVKDVKGLYEAYAKIYIENDDLFDDELIDQIVEELVDECVEFGYTIDEAFNAVVESAELYFDAEELEEAKVTYGADTESPEQRTARAKERLGGMKSAARKAAFKNAAERVKGAAMGAKAVAGIAGSIAKDEAKRASRSVSGAVQKKAQKLKSGIKGLLGKGLRAAAGGAGKVAQVARKAGAAAGKAAEKLGEEVDVFDYILEHLVAEGYADTNENALVIMANMSEEWRKSIVEEVINEKKGERPRGLPYGPVGKGFRELTVPQRAKMIQRGKEHTRAAMQNGQEYSKSHAASSAIDSALRSRRLGGRG